MAYDVIVVGARCAGSPLAMILARRGHRVLLLDRARFPSDTVSTHYIHQPGVARLAEWGLLERVKATGAPPIRESLWDIQGVSFIGTPPGVGDITEGYAPRRTVLDVILGRGRRGGRSGGPRVVHRQGADPRGRPRRRDPGTAGWRLDGRGTSEDRRGGRWSAFDGRAPRGSRDA